MSFVRSSTSRRPRYTGPDDDTRAKVMWRDGYCIRCGETLHERRPHVLHHRRPRAMGGTQRPDVNSPQNLVWLCCPCHDFIEANRAEAYMKGWLVAQSADPLGVPLLVVHVDEDGVPHREAKWVYLTADFGYSDAPGGES
ncbi:MAG TPA: HNH endonuclease signature motif containing protein [Micromonosporaceae bacterium]